MSAIPPSLSAFNSLSVEVYDLSNNLVNDPDRDVRRVLIEGYRKQYPGGLFADGDARVSRKLGRAWLVQGAQRVIFRHGHDVAYEGYIGDVGYEARDTSFVKLPLAGATETFLMNTTHRKLYADARIDESVWRWDTAGTAEAKCTLDRSSRLRFVPKNVEWTANQFAQVVYTQPIGQTTRRVKGSYQLQEGAQDWKIEIFRSTDGSTWTLEYTIANTSTSGTFDRTMGTATRYVAIRYTAGATQTPTADGTYFGEVFNVVIYATIASLTSAITMETVARYLVAEYSASSPSILNSDTQYIASPSTALTVEPYIHDRYDLLADHLDEIISDGDGDLLRWAWGLYDSERAAAPNGLPVLFLQKYPVVSGGEYDYTVDWSAPNLISRPTLVRSLSTVVNWVTISRRDENGWTVCITPDDDAALKNTTSIAANRLRAVSGGLDVGERSAAAALSFGKRFLATYKDKMWRMTGPLEVGGYILDANSNPVPACMIEPGKRVRVTGGPVDDNGDPPIFVMTAADYQHRDQSCSIVAGSPLAPLLPRLAAQVVEAWVKPKSGGVGGGGGGAMSVGVAEPESLNFYKDDPWEAWKKAGGAGAKGKLTWKQKHIVTVWFRHEKKKKLPKI